MHQLMVMNSRDVSHHEHRLDMHQLMAMNSRDVSHDHSLTLIVTLASTHDVQLDASHMIMNTSTQDAYLASHIDIRLDAYDMIIDVSINSTRLPHDHEHVSLLSSMKSMYYSQNIISKIP